MAVSHRCHPFILQPLCLLVSALFESCGEEATARSSATSISSFSAGTQSPIPSVIFVDSTRDPSYSFRVLSLLFFFLCDRFPCNTSCIPHPNSRPSIACACSFLPNAFVSVFFITLQLHDTHNSCMTLRGVRPTAAAGMTVPKQPWQRPGPN